LKNITFLSRYLEKQLPSPFTPTPSGLMMIREVVVVAVAVVVVVVGAKDKLDEFL
jgi:hypothetical protein